MLKIKIYIFKSNYGRNSKLVNNIFLNLKVTKEENWRLIFLAQNDLLKIINKKKIFYDLVRDLKGNIKS